jgi:hypothetical protein
MTVKKKTHELSHKTREEPVNYGMQDLGGTADTGVLHQVLCQVRSLPASINHCFIDDEKGDNHEQRDS